MRPYKNILLLRIDRLGDFVLSIPFFKQLREQSPTAYIHVVVNEKNKIFAEKLRLFNHITPVRTNAPLHPALLKTITCILSRKYDLAVDLIPGTNHLSSLLLFLTRAQHKLGYAVGLRKLILTHKVHLTQLKYEADMILDLLRKIEVTPYAINTDSFSPLKNLVEQKYQDTFLQENSINRSQKIIIIHPGIGAPDIRRLWPQKYYYDLLLLIRKKNPSACIILTGQKNDAPLLRHILAQTEKFKLIDCLGKTTLPQLISLISLAHIIICPLTGTTHIAAALNKPVITLVGPTPITRWTTPHLPYSIVTKNLACSPCEHLPTCIHHGTPDYLACMKTLTPQNVFKKIEAFLD